MIATEMSPLQEIVSNIIETNNPQLIDMFIAELRGYGIDDADKIEKSKKNPDAREKIFDKAFEKISRSW